MRKIKIFSDTHYASVQLAVNEWLSSHEGINILQVLQSECYLEPEWSLTITFVYDEGEQNQ